MAVEASRSEGDSSIENSENEIQEHLNLKNSAKSRKRGIIFLSTIPKFMNVTKIREIFGQYGEIDRVFLQPEEQKGGKKKRKPAKHFTEGWVEFEKKKVAKQVAAMLNNKQIGGRKRSKYYDFIWNIKYLPRFKWVHLSERLAYERAVRKQRVNTEIAQAKREASYFAHNVELGERLSKRKGKGACETRSDVEGNADGNRSDEVLMRQYRQRETDSEIREKKLRKMESLAGGKKVAHKRPTGPIEGEQRQEFLRSLFGKS